MHFVIFTVADRKEKILVRWTEKEILAAAAERLGKERAKILREIMEEFKKETLTIP